MVNDFLADRRLKADIKMSVLRQRLSNCPFFAMVAEVYANKTLSLATFYLTVSALTNSWGG
ncbi:hypothetical protein CBP12_10990 [Oceanisphaera avium]|uniref:Uncharacterized protein n=1 Tax=Oceanisphaera avium TaxID=1903694 RepID=A0A1Y0CZ40_9GAMM|nr:hypothetical protein CBP12_10990 [Oceanisphaera avium]